MLLSMQICFNKWNHARHNILWPSFSLKIFHINQNIYIYLILMSDCMLNHHMDAPWFVEQIPYCWTFRLFLKFISPVGNAVHSQPPTPCYLVNFCSSFTFQLNFHFLKRNFSWIPQVSQSSYSVLKQPCELLLHAFYHYDNFRFILIFSMWFFKCLSSYYSTSSMKADSECFIHHCIPCM